MSKTLLRLFAKFRDRFQGPVIWSNLNCAELISGGYLCPSREKGFEVSLFVPRFCSFLVQMPLCILLEKEVVAPFSSCSFAPR